MRVIMEIPILANNDYAKIIGLGVLVDNKLTITLTEETSSEIDGWLANDVLKAISLDFSKQLSREV